MRIMYISNGEMWLYDGKKTRPVSSQRAEQYAQTLRQLERQYAWKTEGEGAKFMHQSNPYANAAENANARVTGIVPYKDGILYSIRLSGAAGGMYIKDPLDAGSPEGLVTSGSAFQPRDLHMDGGALYFSVWEHAESHIARMDPETGRYDTLTEGDTVERHPFVDSGSATLYFDMRGYARDSEQNIIGSSPSAVVAMDMRSGDMCEIHSGTDQEYSKYTISADGGKCMMVRPYKNNASSNPLGCLLAPFSAIMGFVHVFSSINAARQGKEPPMQHSRHEAAKPLEKKLNIDGVSIDLNQLAREQKQHPDEFSGLVPRDWKLVSVQPDGSLKTLQHGVLDYLPLDDGGYIYSNGNHVLHVNADGMRKLLFKAHLATDLILLPDGKA